MTHSDRQLVDKLYEALTAPDRKRPDVDTLTRHELECLLARLKQQSAPDPEHDTANYPA